ncbi:uncharacterized protein LOC143854275 isoform X2 [Tasmannia lanceolata]|uniref:uncharacterized protein LOC143854275 isoform X2 n=1 Tax=Tasmannia lanceolata TaxID=3420 RepID=UPI00406420E2
MTIMAPFLVHHSLLLRKEYLRKDARFYKLSILQPRFRILIRVTKWVLFLQLQWQSPMYMSSHERLLMRLKRKHRRSKICGTTRFYCQMMQNFLHLLWRLHLERLLFRVLVSTDVEDARPTHVPLKSKPPMSKPLMSKPPRPVSNGHLGRNSISSNRQMQTKLGHQKVASASRSGLSSADPRKLPASNAGNGPGRPMGLKAPLPRAPVSSVVKKTSSVGIHSSVQKAPSSKPISTAQKQYSEQKREPLGLDKHKGMPTRPLSSSKPPDYASSSKPQLKTPKQIPSRTVQENRPKKKQPVNRYSDEDDDNEGDGASISRMIRNMFRYNPNKFAGDDEDLSDMEANFADIQREEKRSARIAREEDERELRLIEEEEKEERLRAKRRKLAQR